MIVEGLKQTALTFCLFFASPFSSSPLLLTILEEVIICARKFSLLVGFVPAKVLIKKRFLPPLYWSLCGEAV